MTNPKQVQKPMGQISLDLRLDSNPLWLDSLTSRPSWSLTFWTYWEYSLPWHLCLARVGFLRHLQLWVSCPQGNSLLEPWPLWSWDPKSSVLLRLPVQWNWSGGSHTPTAVLDKALPHQGFWNHTWDDQEPWCQTAGSEACDMRQLWSKHLEVLQAVKPFFL